MASLKKRLPGNVSGEFYVDSTCIDCDQCRQIAPGTFRAQGEHSIVFRQPLAVGERRLAEKAMVTCPTGSIGATTKPDLSAAIAAYPEPIAGGVRFCGFASEDTYGGSSYLIARPQGNVLVDSPRFARHLVRRLEEMGGVRLMFLTHVDDVGDHAKFRSHFGCDRVMHADDARFAVERRIEGSRPTRLAHDLVAIPTPGHTKGHQVLLYAGRMLFTGDHLAWSEEARSLTAHRDVCWYSWTEQTRSMEKLLAYRFEWVLPGHGRRHHCSSREMHHHLERCVRSMRDGEDS